jgi:hypothetical protein
MAKLAEIKDKQGEGFFFYCPGCKMNHLIPVSYTTNHTHRKGKAKPVWRFNGNLDKPTFVPTFAVEWAGSEPPQRCHCIIRDGELIYLVGSTHELSGKRVKMEDKL